MESTTYTSIFTREPEFDEQFTPEEAAQLLEAMREATNEVPSYGETNAAQFARKELTA